MEIYFDNAATTKPCKEALEAAADCIKEKYGNPSSLHAKGLEAELAVSEARKNIACEMGCEPERIYFTSGATESNNTAIFGIAGAYGKRMPKVVTTSVEHASVREAVNQLEKKGFEVERVSPDENGKISPEKILKAVDERTCLVSMMMVNNETGYILPVKETFTAVKRKFPKCMTHCDAVQGFMKLPLKAESFKADLISISAHKIYGCKGAGALYMKKGVRLSNLIFGGEQENGLRPGTESVPMIAAFGAAVRALKDTMDKRYAYISELKDKLCGMLREMDGVIINSGEDCSPYIINLSVPGVRSEIMLHYLESKGVYVSSGSACSKGKQSGVLTEFGLERKLADSALRISLSPENTAEELKILAQSVNDGKNSIIHS